MSRGMALLATGVVLGLVLFLVGPTLIGPSLFSPTAALASTTTLSILHGSVQHRPGGAGAWKQASDGMTLKAGDGVRTTGESRALITFFEGSTMVLEPDTEVVVQRLEAAADNGATEVALRLEAGKFWSRVAALATPSSSFQVETSTATALVRGTTFGARLDPDLTMVCWAGEGEVRVRSQGQDVVVRAGQETTIRPGQAPGSPRAREPRYYMLRLRAEGPAYVRLVDPLGRSAGATAPGLAVNQVMNAVQSAPLDEFQFVDYPDPVAGRYWLILEARGQGAVRISVGAVSSGVEGEARRIEVALSPGQTMSTAFSLEMSGSFLTASVLTSPSPLSASAPGKLVKAEREARSAAAVATAVASPRGRAPAKAVPTLPVATPLPGQAPPVLPGGEY